MASLFRPEFIGLLFGVVHFLVINAQLKTGIMHKYV